MKGFCGVGAWFGLGMFECADTAFLIGAYPSSQVGSGNAVVVCGTLLAAYMQIETFAKFPNPKPCPNTAKTPSSQINPTKKKHRQSLSKSCAICAQRSPT